MLKQFSTEWDFIVWADTYLDKITMSDWWKQKEQHNHVWVTYNNYLKVFEKNLSSEENINEQNIIVFNTAESQFNNTIMFWYKKLSELFCFLSVTHKDISETLVWNCWRFRLSYHVLTKLQH